jgi:hypothetical protein
MIDIENRNYILNEHKINIHTLLEIKNNKKKIIEKIDNYKYFIIYSSTHISKYILSYNIKTKIKANLNSNDLNWFNSFNKELNEELNIELNYHETKPINYYLANDIPVDQIAIKIKNKLNLIYILDITYYNNYNMNNYILLKLNKYEKFITYSKKTNNIYICTLNDDIKKKIQYQLVKNPIINIGMFIFNIYDYFYGNNYLITNYYLAY